MDFQLEEVPWIPMKQPGDHWNLILCIDEGSFGMVWRGEEKPSGEEVAIKIVTDPDDQLEDMKREINLLSDLKNDFIIGLHGAWTYNDEIWVVMELAELGSLEGLLIYCAKDFLEPEIAAICARVLLGLEFMHSKGFIHRDIKSKNILMKLNGEIKLADFGITQHTSEVREDSEISGTPHFLSPEIVSQSIYGVATDIWCLGITILELVHKEPPHADVAIEDGEGAMALFNMIADGPAPKLKQPFKWTDELKSFLEECVNKDQHKRKTASELLEHDFVKDEVALARKGEHQILKALAEANFDTLESFRMMDEDKGYKHLSAEELEYEIYSEDESDFSDDEDEGDNLLMNNFVAEKVVKKPKKKSSKSRKKSIHALARKKSIGGKSIKPQMRAYKEKNMKVKTITDADLKTQLSNLKKLDGDGVHTKEEITRASNLLNRMFTKKQKK
mmetsp:Transcript_1811/g.2080  ORF Transcript_1811/g.2080 Transcript_1811/m.2080 type:complete len:446 (-) Transcript_1811:360-1697(-)|eukprot:CAMPEP_0184018680 /NCGR_PEP_ID=MMETSP0954-20121128/8285_1 /TAXON_ID=627963 /ORGANISM="Aplanochytrium sp, Strain PBS07" /LENGTH=445 /DNA_ID=CAMNT_0026300171 /DNA_START=452 /DNA_END=1789 /DNA_ORIENTATION=-